MGIDIGGTKVALRLERSGAAIDARPWQKVFPWPESGGVAADLAALGKSLAELPGSAGDPVTSVGVALPAALDTEGRVRGWPNRPTWQGLDLSRQLEAFLPGARIRVADDGDLAALAEARAAGCRDLVHLGVGTGIGGGVVLDGVMRPGTARGSCEVGHVIVDHRAGEPCDCGRRGCVQSLSSGRAVLRRASRLRGEQVDFPALLAACSATTPWATTLIDESASALAAAATSLAELTHPDIITIGGGFATSVPGYLTRVTTHFTSLHRPNGPTPELRPAALGALSSLDGALLLARGVGVSTPDTAGG
nr:ROK family protein [Streptomyces sp. SID13726]